MKRIYSYGNGAHKKMFNIKQENANENYTYTRMTLKQFITTLNAGENAKKLHTFHQRSYGWQIST